MHIFFPTASLQSDVSSSWSSGIGTKKETRITKFSLKRPLRDVLNIKEVGQNFVNMNQQIYFNALTTLGKMSSRSLQAV